MEYGEARAALGAKTESNPGVQVQGLCHRCREIGNKATAHLVWRATEEPNNLSRAMAHQTVSHSLSLASFTESNGSPQRTQRNTEIAAETELASTV